MSASQTLQPVQADRNKLYFNVLLHPYRSLGRKGFFWLMVVFGGLMLIATVPFFLMGAWPVLGFAGLDIALLYWAFRRTYREARAHERIVITHEKVTVIQTSPNGVESHSSFNPYWARLETQYEEDKGMTAMALTSHGERVEIGAFLHACERESLAKALSSALLQAKNSGTQVSGG